MGAAIPIAMKWIAGVTVLPAQNVSGPDGLLLAHRQYY
jgi:hypothetical protein